MLAYYLVESSADTDPDLQSTCSFWLSCVETITHCSFAILRKHSGTDFSKYQGDAKPL